MKKKFLIIISLVLTSFSIFAQHNHSNEFSHIHTRGYATMDSLGVMKPFEFNQKVPGNDDIIVDIMYSGVCHSDIHSAFNHWGWTKYPYIPGHEIVGVVTETGKNVTDIKKGDYVAIGAINQYCGICEMCRAGQEQYCLNSGGSFTEAGYSDKIVIPANVAFKLSDNAPLEKIAPLMCAGITVYTPIKAANIQKGDNVAVAGFGGLGHLALMYAVSFGAEVTVFDVSEDKRELAYSLGAKKFVNVNNSEEMKGMEGSFKSIFITISSKFDVNQYANMVRPLGNLAVIGIPANKDAPLINTNTIPFGIHITKPYVGGIAETKEMLDYSATHNIYPIVEIIPIQDINKAFQNVVEGKVHFRYVIDMKSLK